ncbi:MAG: two-component system cell cycle sensor histidine kinase/response regulator CckA [Myxococcota bacterium]|jgi:two-component system cell cycle sensor histidine kinase/response regulator CckA
MSDAQDCAVGTSNEWVTRQIPEPTPGLDLPVLPKRADRLLSLLVEMDAYVTEADSEPKTIYASPGTLQVTGYTPEEVILGDCVEIHASDQDLLVTGAIALAKYGTPFSCLVRLKHKCGDWRWIEVSSLASYASEDGGYRSMSLNRDVTKLINAQRDVVQSEERYRVVSEMSRDMITESTADGQTMYVSPAVSLVLGWTDEELSAQEPYTLVHPEDVDRIRSLTDAAVLSGKPVQYDAFRIRAKSGEYLWFTTSSVVYKRSDGEIRILAVTHNITEQLEDQAKRRDLEEQMVSAQKLESLGVMAGGIAHDFNNLLTPILGEASLVLADLPANSPLRVRLMKIQRAAERAASLTHQMLSYAGKGPLQLERLNLTHLVDEMGRLFESAVSGKTQLEFELTPALPSVEADASQISQVVINLISNASEALPDGAGKITVRTGVIDLPAAPSKAVFAEQLVAGPHVYIEVVDTGCGMDAATAAKIFDPFFTTKFTGRGLGLAAVAGIVRGHRGALEIESEPGIGTVFRVMFPATDGEVQQVAKRDQHAAKWAASETVLIIDDDEWVRDLASDILARAGLHVMTAADGREGVEVFKAHADEIALVVLDRTMPKLSGFETFQALREIRADVPVILVSGYSEESAAAELSGVGLAGFLQKPFLPEALLEIVVDVMPIAT